jgi:hypothetical protein
VYEFVSNAGNLNLRSPAISVSAQFDEFRLDVEIEYQGDPIELMNRLPTEEELATASGTKMLSHYIIRDSADQVRVKQRDGRCVLYLHFEHWVTCASIPGFGLPKQPCSPSLCLH